jgi:IS1 family transposase
MNVTPEEKQVQILKMLVEGNSIRSIERITGVHRDTIIRILVRVGDKCQKLLDDKIKNFHSKNIEIDECWAYVKKKDKHLTPQERTDGEYGSQYVFIALDADTKLVPTFTVGKRTTGTAIKFVLDLKRKLNGNGRIQLTSDGYPGFRVAVEDAFGSDVDYAQLIKIFNPSPHRSYSPPELKETTPKVISGKPEKKHISTSYVERQNLTIRMQMRRFTRLTNAFSKKLENLKAALALHFCWYNLGRIHQTLRVTPAMEAGITDHVWSMGEILAY